MKSTTITSLLVAGVTVLPLVAQAQSQTEIVQEMRRTQAALGNMQTRMNELEAALKQKNAEVPGMNAEQERELNRLSVMADAQVDANTSMGIKGLKISGSIDPTYIYTKNQNRAGFQFLNSSVNPATTASPAGAPEFAFDNGAFGAAILDIQKEMESGTKFHLTLIPNRVGAGNTIDGKSIVHEASIWMPITGLDGTRLLAGQVPSWEGYEALESYRNKLITHNLLFDFTIPASFTGVGFEKALNSKYTLKTMVANINSSKKPNSEKSTALVFRADYFDYAQEFTYLALVGMVGKLPNYRAAGASNPITTVAYDGTDALVKTLELEGGYTRGDWSIAGQVSVGAQRNAAITADPVSGNLRDSSWWGASTTIGYKFNTALEGVVRLDYLNNQKNGGGTFGGWNFADSRNGLGPDPVGNPEVGANRSEITLGMRYNFNANTVFKVEYRYDRASLPVFVDVRDGTFKRDNQLFGTSMVLSF
ncbi:DUF3138 family protein [Undibacterium sp.]|uniref:DUF3138 family protein n=1 Tax=Undibacterium sp. TaxID=1914977 RepID=UPI0025DCE9FD|nr:DUF3138 family protein [Undibacterium sp.]